MIRVLQFGMSGNYGGIESFIYEMYRNLDHNKIQFDFVNSTNGKIAYQDEILKLGGRVYSFNPPGIKGGLKNSERAFLNFYKMVKPDILHYNTTELSTLLHILYAKKSGIDIRIVHAHNSTSSKEKNIIRKVECIVNRHLVHSVATHLFACSELAGKWMFSRDFQIIPNAISLDKFCYSCQKRRSMRELLNLKDSFTIVHSGKLSDVKNQTFLLDIFFEVVNNRPNSKLILLGEGEKRSEIENKISNLGLKEKVLIPGSVNNVEDYLCAGDIFIFPSKSEGFGISLLEAQASGLPCIASKNVIPKEVNVSGEIEFLSLNKSAKYWAKHVLNSTIHSDFDRINGKSKFISYDVKKCANELQDFYLGVLK